MIVDHRTYAIKPGKLNEFLKLYEKEMLPLQLKYLGHCVGWYVSNDIGPLSQIVHMWAYKNLADREERRGRLAQDPVSRPTSPRRSRFWIAWRTRSCSRLRSSHCRK